MQILHIALSYKNITINKLITLFKMSKNTIINGIKELKKELSLYHLKLTSSIKTGYIIKGEEMAVRKMIWAQLQKLSTPECQFLLVSLCQECISNLTENDVDYFELCRCLVKQYETDVGEDFFLLSTITTTCVMIQTSWVRSLKGAVIEMSHDEYTTLMGTLTYRSVELSWQKLNKYELLIPYNEIYYISSLFLGIQTSAFITQEEENLFISDLSNQLITNFERIGCLSFISRERLLKQLVNHVRPLYYRLKYGITSKNPLVKDIFRMYPIVGDFTRRAVKETKLSILEDIPKDEIAYLCIYFASNLHEKYVQQSGPEICDVLIIGADNIVTVTFVREQLKNLFGLSMRYNVISADRVREWIQPCHCAGTDGTKDCLQKSCRD